MKTVAFASLRWFVDSSDSTWTRIWRTHIPYPGSMGETEWLNVRTSELDPDEIKDALAER